MLEVISYNSVRSWEISHFPAAFHIKIMLKDFSLTEAKPSDPHQGLCPLTHWGLCSQSPVRIGSCSTLSMMLWCHLTELCARVNIHPKKFAIVTKMAWTRKACPTRIKNLPNRIQSWVKIHVAYKSMQSSESGVTMWILNNSTCSKIESVESDDEVMNMDT
jgi:hypothetical protein